MTKENPCNKCCSYKQNKVCECNELFAYRHYLQGREDGIDDLVRKVKEHYTTKEITYYDGTTDTVSYVALALLEQIAENLKENKNDKR